MEGITRDYVGFCKGMKPMTVGKIANQLEKKSIWLWYGNLLEK